MGMSSKKQVGLLGLVAAILAGGMPVAAQAPDLAMLGTLDRGAWELRLRGGSAPQRLCVRTGREFIQIVHRQRGCTSLVVEDGRSSVTVQYTCPGEGYGRTTIRREGSGLVQIRSQGIQAGAPFSLEGEARRIGAC